MLAAAAGAGCVAAVHGEARVDVTDETPAQMARFTARRARRFDLALSNGGWLRLKRGRGGRMLVCYRVSQLKAGLTLEGEIHLENEPAESFCRELGGLL